MVSVVRFPVSKSVNDAMFMFSVLFLLTNDQKAFLGGAVSSGGVITEAIYSPSKPS